MYVDKYICSCESDGVFMKNENEIDNDQILLVKISRHNGFIEQVFKMFITIILFLISKRLHIL